MNGGKCQKCYSRLFFKLSMNEVKYKVGNIASTFAILHVTPLQKERVIQLTSDVRGNSYPVYKTSLCLDIASATCISGYVYRV